jgi:hypothetical protein
MPFLPLNQRFINNARGVSAVLDSDDFEIVSCRVAIQVCVGKTPGGRPSHRTFSIKGIKPSADITVLASLVRDVIAPLLAYPVTKARLFTKKVRVLPTGTGKTAPAPQAAPVTPPSPCRFTRPIETLRRTIRAGLPTLKPAAAILSAIRSGTTASREPACQWRASPPLCS